MKILVLDNYDSFVYNLVHILYEFEQVELDVFKNDKITLEAVAAYDKILLSPGPGVPKDAGIMPELIKQYATKKSIFGVCLGHQAIAEAFGGKLINLKEPLHGIESTINRIEAHSIFENIPTNFQIGHYHSWVVDENLPKDLIMTSKDERGNIMSLKHKRHAIHGVQFHPESILTEHGKTIIANWINE